MPARPHLSDGDRFTRWPDHHVEAPYAQHRLDPYLDMTYEVPRQPPDAVQPRPAHPVTRRSSTSDRSSRSTSARPQSPLGLLSRGPLLLRLTLVAGLVGAIGVSLVRAQGGPADGSGQILGPGTTSVAAEAGSVVESCRIEHAVTSQFAGRFAAVMTIFNTGTDPVEGWTLRWTYAGRNARSMPHIAEGWNAAVSENATGGQAIDIAQNRVIPAGGSTTIGFIGSIGAPSAKAPVPSGFTLNGVACQ